MTADNPLVSHADLERARQCHGALREIFIHHPGGRPDREALHNVKSLAWQAMTALKDAECQEQMGIVEHHAAALYSEAEHHKWRMASLPGADFLRLQILRALVAFHSRLLAIEVSRRNSIDPNLAPRQAPTPEDDMPRPA